MTIHFVDVGDGTFINLEKIQRVEFDEKEPRAQIFWTDGKTSFLSGNQAFSLAKKVAETIPESWRGK